MTDFRSLPSDPFALKALSKWNPRRLAFTGYYRAADRLGGITYKSIGDCINLRFLQHFYTDTGIAVSDTALTATKISLLLDAVNESNEFSEPIIEIGSYRGVTTSALAAATKRNVYAVDPYIGYGGTHADEHIFKQRVAHHPNVRHFRCTSGQALGDPRCASVSMVFIDAVNDFANSWFNCVAWTGRIRHGGFLAVNQIDEWPGPNLTCRRLLRFNNAIVPWGYCRDLIVFSKLS